MEHAGTLPKGNFRVISIIAACIHVQKILQKISACITAWSAYCCSTHK